MTIVGTETVFPQCHWYAYMYCLDPRKHVLGLCDSVGLRRTSNQKVKDSFLSNKCLSVVSCYKYVDVYLVSSVLVLAETR